MNYPRVNIIEDEKAREVPAVDIKMSDLMDISDLLCIGSMRSAGCFKGKAIFLESAWEWLIGLDDTNSLVLLKLNRGSAV